MNVTHQFNRLLAYLSINRQQFLTFLLVGIINTAFGYGVFVLFIYAGLHYIIASILSTIIAVVFSFTTMGKIVFKQFHNGLFTRYIAVYVASSIISIIFIGIGTFFTPNVYLLGALTIFPTVCFTYVVNKYYVFKWIPYETH